MGGKNGDCTAVSKKFSKSISDIYEMSLLEGSSTPTLYIEHIVAKVKVGGICFLKTSHTHTSMSANAILFTCDTKNYISWVWRVATTGKQVQKCKCINIRLQSKLSTIFTAKMEHCNWVHSIPSSNLGCHSFKSQPTDYVQVLHACPQFYHINTSRVTQIRTHLLPLTQFRFSSH